MHIDLNGMPFILKIHWAEDGQTLLAEIVDEAFALAPMRRLVTSIPDVAGLIEDFAGLVPGRDTLRLLNSEFSELFEDQAILLVDQPAALPQSSAS